MADYTTTAAAVLPITVDEAKAHLNISHASDDTLIDSYIRAATAMVEKRTNRCFATQTRTLLMDGFADSRYVHSRRIYPDRSPIKNSSGVAITYVAATGTTTTLPTSDYVVSFRERPGCIAEAYGAAWPSVRVQPNSVTITYVAGHSTLTTAVPYHIKLALQMLVAHLYRFRESHTETALAELPMGVAALLESEHLETYG